MQTVKFLMLAAIAAVAARADFSYTTVTKTAMGEHTSKHYIKGQKMITDNGDTVTVMDLDAQTMTIINRTAKTYSVKPFSELFKQSSATATTASADFKKTGQHKNINGFDAEEVVVTMAVENTQSKQPAAKVQMQMEMHLWIAADVPGIEEEGRFFQRNADRMPWAAMTQGSAAMADMQRKLAAMHGIPVLQTMKMQNGNPQQQAQMDQNMAQMRAKMEEMKKQGGQQAAMADQILARMGAASSGSAFDSTSESTGFSTTPVPDSVFAIPADYRNVGK